MVAIQENPWLGRGSPITKPIRRLPLTAFSRTARPTKAKNISIGPQASGPKHARSRAHTPGQSRQPAGLISIAPSVATAVIASAQPHQAPTIQQPDKAGRGGHHQSV